MQSFNNNKFSEIGTAEAFTRLNKIVLKNQKGANAQLSPENYFGGKGTGLLTAVTAFLLRYYSYVPIVGGERVHIKRKGQSIWIEAMAQGLPRRRESIEFERAVTKHGATYYQVSTLDELFEVVAVLTGVSIS